MLKKMSNEKEKKLKKKNPVIHLLPSHQLYIIWYHIKIWTQRLFYIFIYKIYKIIL